MRHTLPLLETRAPATGRCTYCPKLCRPACPISTVEGRETVTPWGKMRGLDEVIRGEAHGHQAERFEKAWACTGCGACRTLCLLDNPVADTLWDGRADAFANDMEPPSVHALAETFDARLKAVRTRGKALEAKGNAGETVRVLTGCLGVEADPDEALATAEAVGALEGHGCGVAAGECCGVMLHDAGDRAGFVAQAKKFAASLDGVERLVVVDAGCAHCLRRVYPQFGVALPTVEHLSEVAARHAEKLGRVEEARAVVYHDPCRLGRGLGLYDEPRAVLGAVLGRAPGEFAANREHGHCSGAGGLLPVTRPETAKGIANELAGEARSVGAEVVVTGCASSARQMAKAGVAVESFASWVIRGVKAGVQSP